jgi:hypothetical protein
MGGIVSDNVGRSSGLVKAASGGTGEILQVVSATHATEVDCTSTSYTDSGLDVAITPSATSSKVLIYCNLCTSHVSGYYYYLTLYRDATDLSGGDAQGMLALNSPSGHMKHGSGFLYLDSPSSTSALTYSLFGRSETSGQSLKMCNGNSVGSIIAYEIDGS